MEFEQKIAELKQIHMPAKRLDLYVGILSKLEQQYQMPQDQILAYASKIRPLMRGTETSVSLSPATLKNELFWVASTPIHNESFVYRTKKPLQKATGLVEVARVTTYYKSKRHGMLQPSADEAIIQCPEEIRDKVCGFEFQTPSIYVGEVFNSCLDRQVLTTVYYAGSVPAEIAATPVEW